MSNNQIRGSVPKIDYDRVTRPTDPKLRQPIPAMNVPVENANQTVDKVAVTLNRAGTNPRNPILRGLGHRLEWFLGRADEATGIFIYQDRASLGPNLLQFTDSPAQGMFGLNTVAGLQYTVSGDIPTGAKQNFVRFESRRGKFEKVCWIKSKDADIIACNGINMLDSQTLDKVPLLLTPLADEDYIQVSIDFFVSWNDEFGVMHTAKQPALDPGFLKSYGGSAYVSFFDVTPGTEGVGTQCVPVTQAPINDQHIIEIENVPGVKDIRVRFRSKEDSTHYVDVDIQFIVDVAEVGGMICNPPNVEDNYNIYIPPTPPFDPPYTPDTPSTPTDTPTNVPPITTFHPDPTINNPPVFNGRKGVVTLSGQKPQNGSTPLVQVDRWGVVAPNQYWYRGAEMTKQNTKYYNPAVTDMQQAGILDHPYDPRKKYTICLDLDADEAAFVCFYTVTLIHINDQGIMKQGQTFMVSGPYWRQMNGLPQLNLGYGPGSCGGSGFPNIADNGSCPV